MRFPFVRVLGLVFDLTRVFVLAKVVVLGFDFKVDFNFVFDADKLFNGILAFIWRERKSSWTALGQSARA